MAKKNNMKFAIGATIALLVLFGATLGIGYWIGDSTRRDDNYVKFFINNKEYDLNNKKTSREVASQEDGDDLVSQFYSAALFGDTDYNNPIGDDDYNYIFNSSVDDWNQPYIITQGIDAKTLHENFVNIKFAKDTISTPVYEYLVNLDSRNPEIISVIIELENILPDTYQSANIFEVASETDLYMDIIEALTNDPTYQKDVLEDIFVYSYLWQDSSMSIYDYNLTREMVKAAPSMVAKASINSEKMNPSNSDWTKLRDLIETENISADEWNTMLMSADFQDSLVDNTILDDQIDNGTLVGFKGFSGIQFGTSAGTGIKDDWKDSTHTWDTETNNITGNSLEDSITINGEYQYKDVMSNANIYVPDDTTTGALIGANDDWGLIGGEVSIYAYSQLIPYTFAQKVETVNGNYLMGQNSYSLFSKGDTNLTIGNIDDFDNYIFDDWFGSNSIAGEIYLAEALVDNNPDITTRAYEYWQDKGFYIELSGTYRTDYLSYVPAGLIKDENN